VDEAAVMTLAEVVAIEEHSGGKRQRGGVLGVGAAGAVAGATASPPLVARSRVAVGAMCQRLLHCSKMSGGQRCSCFRGRVHQYRQTRGGQLAPPSSGNTVMYSRPRRNVPCRRLSHCAIVQGGRRCSCHRQGKHAPSTKAETGKRSAASLTAGMTGGGDDVGTRCNKRVGETWQCSSAARPGFKLCEKHGMGGSTSSSRSFHSDVTVDTSVDISSLNAQDGFLSFGSTEVSLRVYVG
jgi:hypothetical protein